MTRLVTGRPPKGAWKKDIDPCTRRGHHLYRVNTATKHMVCTEPGCDYTSPWVVKGPMPPKNPGVAKRRTK